MESTSLDDVLYRYASFRNLVDPITHDLVISLARYIQCPPKTGPVEHRTLHAHINVLTQHVQVHTGTHTYTHTRMRCVLRPSKKCMKRNILLIHYYMLLTDTLPHHNITSQPYLLQCAGAMRPDPILQSLAGKLGY